MKRYAFLVIFLHLGLCWGFSQNILIVQEKGFYGALDMNGNRVLPSEYDFIRLKSKEYFYELGKNNKIGLADSTGKVLYECVYDQIDCLASTIFLLTQGTTTTCSFISGQEASKPGRLKYYSHISSRFATIKIDSSLLIVDKLSNTIKKSSFDSIGVIISMENERTNIFSFIKDSYYFPVYINHKQGIVDQDLKVIIPLKFDRLYLSIGYWYAQEKGTLGVFDIEGKELIKTGKYISIQPRDNRYFEVQDKHYGICDKNGKLLIPTIYDEVSQDQEYWKVKKDNKFSILSHEGKTLIGFNWDGINYLGNDIFQISKITNEKSLNGIINSSGTILAKPKYDKITDVGDGNFKLEVNNTKCIMNSKGKILFEGSYPQVDYYSKNKLFMVKGADKKKPNWGVVNQFNQLLLDTLYDRSAIDFKPNEINLRSDSSLTTLSLEPNGKLIEKIVYKNYIDVKIDTINQNHWEVKKFDKSKQFWALLSKSDKVLIPYIYSGVDRNFWGNKRKTLAILIVTEDETEKRSFSIIDDDKVKILIDSIIYFDNNSLAKFPLIKCVKKNMTSFLISKDLRKASAEYKFMDNFSQGYARVISKGYITSKKDEGYSLFERGVSTNRDDPYLIYSKCIGGKWGLIDTLGRQTIDCKYNFLLPVFDNKIITVSKGRWGVINLTDSVLIPFDYDQIAFFRENSPKYDRPKKCKYYLARKGSFWGVIDEQNKLIVNIEYQEISYKSTGKGDFFVVKRNGKKGMVDTQNNLLIPIEYADIDTVCNHFFKVSRSYFYHQIQNVPLTGYMNEKFSFQILPRFYDAYPFENGFAKVSLRPRKYKFIDRQGNFIVDEEYDDLKNFKNERAAVRLGRNWGYINTKGEKIIEAKYWYASDFSENLAVVGIVLPPKFFGLIRPKQRLAIIDTSERVIKITKYREISNFKNGYAKVRKRNFGLIDSLGNECIPTKYRELYGVNDFKLVVAKASYAKTKLFLRTGHEFKLATEYERVGPFAESKAWVQMNKKYGFIDSTGNLFIDPVYDFAGNFSCGLAKVRKDKMFAYVNDSALACPLIYGDCQDFKYDYAKVKLNRKTFYITKDIDSIVPPKYVSEKVPNFYADRGIYGNNIVNSNLQKINRSYYFELKRFNSENFIVKSKLDVGGVGICGADGRPVVLDNLNYLSPPKEGLSVVSLDKLHGLFNSEGKQVLDVQYIDISKATDSIVKVTSLTSISYFNVLTQKTYEGK